MRLRRVLSCLRLPLAGLGLALLLGAQMPVSTALACSGGPIPLPAERFAPGAENFYDGSRGIVVLGETTGESDISWDVSTAPPPPAPPQPSGSYVMHTYLSYVNTVVALSGEVPDVVRVGPNGFGAPDCSGGPRLFKGEKVLLFLYPSRGYLGAPGDPKLYGDWQSGQFGTPILFDGDSARYLSWARYSNQGEGSDRDQYTYVGSSAEVLKLALDYFGATPEEREAAYRFVLGHSEPTAEELVSSPRQGEQHEVLPAPVPTQPPNASPGQVTISPPDTGDGGLLP